jgi:hypothetical protein
MKNYKEVLIKSIKKQKELLAKDEWRQQLLSYAPPVLWFGDNNSAKPKIITVGANPSRSEFLDGNKKSIEKLNYSDLKYLNKTKRRLYHFKNEITSLGKDFPYQEIIDSYNQYFHKGSNPYTQWFGRSGKVEGLLNGFDASFYAKDEYKYQALHLDLFPFATLKDFKTIEDIAKRDLFDSNWSKSLLAQLIENTSPELIIVFGKTNYCNFKSFFSKEIVEKENLSGRFKIVSPKDKEYFSDYWIGRYNQTNLVGLSLNLGNPRGFKTEDVVKLGQKIKKQLF